MTLGAVYEAVRSKVKLMLSRGVRRSYSQGGEDAILLSLLKEKRGTYIDIGAYHPTLYSNTYAFYQRGWQGLVVDPNGALQDLYALMRPRDRFIRAAVGKAEGIAEYFRFSDGAYNTLFPTQAAACKKNPHIRFLGSEPVPVRPLCAIIHEAGIAEVDLLSIDIEGMDIEALESYDWSIPPRIIAVEDTAYDADAPQESPVYRLLRGKGYQLVAAAPLTLIFAKENASRTKHEQVL